MRQPYSPSRYNMKKMVDKIIDEMFDIVEYELIEVDRVHKNVRVYDESLQEEIELFIINHCMLNDVEFQKEQSK